MISKLATIDAIAGTCTRYGTDVGQDFTQENVIDTYEVGTSLMRKHCE